MRERGGEKERERETVGDRGRERRGWNVHTPRDAQTTSFFFTHFPDTYMAMDMWRIFQRWGRVWEVFIPARRDRNGKRFGFVKILDVIDPERMARQMDQ